MEIIFFFFFNIRILVLKLPLLLYKKFWALDLALSLYHGLIGLYFFPGVHVYDFTISHICVLLSSLRESESFSQVVLKVWLLDQQHQLPVGAC